jgi:lipoprotein-anchoring transpeptidase ErfK/SrfK
MANRPARPIRHPPRARRKPGEGAEPGALKPLAIGFVVAAAAAAAVLGWSSVFEHEPPPGDVRTSHVPPGPSGQPVRPRPAARATDGGGPADAGGAQERDAGKPYNGPLIGAIVPQASIFSTMEWIREKRIGYIRLGSKAPVDPTPIKASNCEPGWYRLVGGGFVCGKHATLDLNNPQVRLGTTPPNLDDVLPYRYAWNTTMGTPLYRSVPSRDEMADYEPYLKIGRRKREGTSSDPGDEAEGSASQTEDPYAADAGPAGPAAANAAQASAETKKPWWQNEPDAGKQDIKLSDLTEGADRTVARRLVKGFYIAIDKTFAWNNRLWYKTTGSLIAPADRFAMRQPPTLTGMELGAADPKQPAGFILGTKAAKYQIVTSGEKHQVSVQAPAARFTLVHLTGITTQIGNTVYRETTEGWWMRSSDGTYTEPGPPPDGLLPNEKWIDVNLKRQTLVAFEGAQPVYASLISSGREGKDPTDKAHDHQTVQGTFRIREKHITVTMDGDGPAPGDMPYSIEDVPYVMYFEGSYALHGAFWHNNFGHQQSHGCVNLPPLAAKWVFFWADPPLPQGWHGVLSQKETPGTRVVVHE